MGGHHRGGYLTNGEISGVDYNGVLSKVKLHE